MILDNGVIENAIEFAFEELLFEYKKKFLWSIVLATWCMIMDNRVIKNALLVAFITLNI